MHLNYHRLNEMNELCLSIGWMCLNWYNASSDQIKFYHFSGTIGAKHVHFCEDSSQSGREPCRVKYSAGLRKTLQQDRRESAVNAL